MFDLLIPVKKNESLPGYFKISRRAILSSAHESDILPLFQLDSDLKKINISTVIDRNLDGKSRSSKKLNSKQEAASYILVRRNKVISNTEGYELEVVPKGIEIIAGSDAGAYYGLQTLRELIRIHGKRIPCCHIYDRPTFSRRGVYLDCSRGKVPNVDTLKSLIEQLAHWKINEVQLYIENVFKFKKHPEIGKGFSPFTAKDILEIQTHCKAHHIKFVPSLASFGHMEKILMLPQYSHLGEMPDFWGLPGGTTLCPTNPRSIKLLADLYSEFLPLFEAEDFNICGDEPLELGKGRSKQKASKIGVGQVYLDFILKIRQLCLKHGKRMNMWGDIVLKHPEIIPLIPKDIVMLNWDYNPDGKRIPRTKEFADARLAFVCCPGTNAWQSHGSRLQTAIDNVSVFAHTALKHGAEGLLNTDWGDGGHRNTLAVSLCSFAHGAAHAWNTQAVDDTKHLRNFTFHTFYDCNGKLAKALKILGHTQSGYWAYHALTENLQKGVPLMKFYGHGGAVINDVSLSPEQIDNRIQSLSSLSWPKPDKKMELFEAISLREFCLACEMDRLAYRRVQLARVIRSGRNPRTTEIKQHISEMQNMTEYFAKLWRLRNRHSRLCENTSALRAAIRELNGLRINI